MATITVMHLYSKTNVEPQVGLGGTVLMYSDTYPVTIVRVQPREIVVQEDKATPIPGRTWPLKADDYTYESDPKARLEIFTLRKNGRWVKAGQSMNGERLMVGPRKKYLDPSF